MASIGMNHEEAPDQHRDPPAMLYQSVFPFSPPNAEPLLPASEVKA